MSIRTSLLIALVAFGGSCNAQSNDWLSGRQQEHLRFHNQFHTKDYICEVKVSSEVQFDIAKNAWTVDSKGKYKVGNKELVRIIKSDDITSPIALCGVNDSPQSNDSYANKYFCLVMTHPKSDGYGRFLTKPDDIDATHYKCLLDIKTRYGKSDVNTLICSGRFKFSLTFSKYFDNDLLIGPYNSFGEKLSQKIEAADCNSINN